MKKSDAPNKQEKTDAKVSGKLAGRLLDDDELEQISGGAENLLLEKYWIINGASGNRVAGPFNTQFQAVKALNEMKKRNPTLNLEIRKETVGKS